MAENSRGILFRKRNILGAALVAGVGLGIYLGKLGWMGFGTGSPGDATGKGSGQTVSKDASAPNSDGRDTQASIQTPHVKPITVVPDVVKVLIDDRQFLIRGAATDTSTNLADLVDLVKKAPGDADGYKLRIYQKLNARMSAAEKLKEALASGGIPDDAILWVPLPAKD